jgi:hypothetical protein
MRKRTIVIGAAGTLAAIITFTSCGSSDSTPAAAPAASSSAASDAGEMNGHNLAPGDAIQVGDLEVRAAALKAGTSLGSNKTVCTTVTYRNTGDDRERFSLIDWKLQDPQGAAMTSSIIGADKPLSTGELAPGGTVTGPVCFTDPAVKGEYRIQFSPMFGGDTVEWVDAR